MNHASRWTLAVILAGIVAIVPTWSLAQRGSKAKRVAPPKFAPSDGSEYFFSDVFSTLQGPRPDLQKGPAAKAGAAGTAGTDGGNAAVAGWAAAISSETIENEIKSVKTSLDTNVTTPTKFRSGDYRLCRTDFTVTAMLFGIIHEYDGDVRFAEGASGLRDLLARAARNCSTGSPQTYAEAKLRKTDLQDLVGGAKFQGQPGDPDATWDKICDRSPLMQRLELAFEKRLQPALASAASFKDNKDMLIHEAELVAAMSMVLMKEGMADGDADDYKEFCEEMKKGAGDIVSGAKQGNYEAARNGAGAITKSCSVCHENYRG